MAVTCFRPTPSGDLHLGSIWNAWANWRLAKLTGGSMVLVMDDVCLEFGRGWDAPYPTNKLLERYLEDLAWFGIVPDRVEWSSSNAKRHEWAGAKLGYRKPEGIAYRPQWGQTRGVPSWDPDNFGDRPDPLLTDAEGPLLPLGPTGFYPWYLTACLVDDYDFGITAWVAGRDLLPMMFWVYDGYDRLGFVRPDIFIHRCFKVSAEAEKLSKSGARERSVRAYRKAEYEPGRILETLVECNVRSWIAGHEYNIIPKDCLMLDGKKPRYLKWRNRAAEERVEGKVLSPLPEPWWSEIREATRRELRGMTRIAV